MMNLKQSDSDSLKVDIEFDSLKESIQKIREVLSRPHRHLCLQWLKKLQNTDVVFRREYINRMHVEIIQGYLCSPFNAQPPVGQLNPLPPPHTHSNEADCPSDLSSNASSTNSSVSLSKLAETNPSKVFKCGNIGSDVSLERPLNIDLDGKDIVRVRSEPNVKSKFHLRTKRKRDEKWDEKLEDGDGSGNSKDNFYEEQDMKIIEHAFKEFDRRNQENEQKAKRNVKTVENSKRENIMESIGDVDKGLEDSVKIVFQEENKYGAMFSTQREKAVDFTRRKTTESEEDRLKSIKHLGFIAQNELLSENDKTYDEVVNNTKKIEEMFLNEIYTLDTDKDVEATCSKEDGKHLIYDIVNKYANHCETRDSKTSELETKIETLTHDNERLLELNQKYKVEIEKLSERIEKLNDKIYEMNVEEKNKLVDCDKGYAASLTSEEKLAEITDKLCALLEKSNRQNEKLDALDVKFNQVRNDYELERKEMLVKFKSIDSLHQNILTELVKRQMSEAKEYQSLIDHYRTQCSKKNAELAQLQNSACEVCSGKMVSGKNKGDERGDTGGTNSEQKLRQEIAHLTQINKDLIYGYERKMKKLMNEKYLETKLLNTMLKAQKEEIELHLTGQKHDELRKLAENLESQYSRIVDEAMKRANSQTDMSV